MFNMSWDNCVKKVESLDDVEHLLDGIHRNAFSGDAPLVTIECRPGGDSLTVGLGRDISILSYVPGDNSPPYLLSVGDLRGEEVMVFRFMGDRSEFPLKNGIPIAVARTALHYFCSTGKLSESVHWEPC